MVTFLPLKIDKKVTLIIDRIFITKKGVVMFDGSLLTERMKEKNMTNKDIAEFVSMHGIKKSEESFKAYRQGRATPPPAVLDLIAEALGCTVLDLDDNGVSKKREIAKMEIMKNRDMYSYMFPEVQLRENIITVPMAYTGAGAEAIVDIETIEKIHIEKKLLPDDTINRIDDNTMAFKIVGDSMSPNYNEDDILFVDMINGRSVRLGDGVWLIRIGETIQVKQIQFIGNGDVKIISLNDSYPTINTQDEKCDWEIIGKPFMRWSVEFFSGLTLL